MAPVPVVARAPVVAPVPLMARAPVVASGPYSRVVAVLPRAVGTAMPRAGPESLEGSFDVGNDTVDWAKMSVL